MKDGGPAFPMPPGQDAQGNYTRPEYGMSLRDWFAGQVLASAAALPFGTSDYKHRARVAYEMADAMLAARNN